MEVTTVTTSGENTLLPAIRAALDDADEALLCVAFVQNQGVHLLTPQLDRLTHRARLLLTTVFQPTTSAISMARKLGTKVAVMNPPGGTFHPKVFLTRHGEYSTAVIGSSNLTGGLVNNVEAAVVLRGKRTDAPIAQAWAWAEELWADPRTRPWVGIAAEPPVEEVFDPALLQALKIAVSQTGGVFHTLGPKPQPNKVTNVTPGGIYIETERSRAKKSPPQVVPAWMFTLAWDYLRTHGRLTNRYLLSTDGLNVKRSSAACAILAKLPGVRTTVSRSEGILLEWVGA